MLTMSAKLMYRFTEENPDLHKRIGCMNGIFQHFVIGRRANQKRLPAAQSENGHKQTKGMLLAVKDKNQTKPVKEKQRPSSESSRTSCSSTFSSIDCNKASQLEVSSSAKQSGRQDLRDAVKESIKRETCGLSINSMKREDKTHTIKHIDSPRPVKLLNCTKAKLANIDEAKNSRNSSPIDAPRFSYDERESRQKSKFKELPRLSLDGRAGSMRNQSSFGNEMEYTNTRRSFNSLEEHGNFNRTSSVVAKLMGLDPLPIIEVNNDSKLGKPFQDKDLEYFPSASSVTKTNVYQNRMNGSPRNSEQVDISPSLRNTGLARKSSLRTPIQPLRKPAPKHLKTHTANSRLSAKRVSELEFGKSGKDLRAFLQILETMQKTKEILLNNQYQFSDSVTHNTPSFSSHEHTPKNLKNVQNKPSISAKMNQITPRKSSESPIVIMKPVTLVRKSSNSASTIVPIEVYPGRLPRLRTNGLGDKQNTFMDKQTKNDLIPKEDVRFPSNGLHGPKYSGRVKTDQTSKVALQTTDESLGGSRIISGALSPRLQRKQLILEKQSHPANTSSDSSKPRRQSTRHMTESNSPGKRTRTTSPRLQKFDDQSSETSCVTICTNHQEYSDGTTSFLSWNDAYISSTGDSEDIISTFYQQVGKKHQSPAVAKWAENGSTAKLAVTATEQPSPVSVLGATFYDDDMPSPVKKITLAFEGKTFPDDGTLSSDESVWTSSASYHISESIESNLSFDDGHLILENSRQSAQYLGHLSYSQAQVSVGWIKNDDHKYIFEILFASGLLSRDLNSLASTGLHPIGYIINPDLFLVLEQAKQFSHDEPIKKIHRSLVFDGLNEILVSKVSSQNKRKNQPSLKEVCAEIDHCLARNSSGNKEDVHDTISHILREELKRKSSNWEELGSDISALVLDIERSIFRELVTEVVDGEAAARIQCRVGGRHRRKLSAN